MFFIPLDRKPDWRRPPLAVIGLVLANVLVFLLIQGNEDARLQDVLRYYEDSGLMLMERETWEADRQESGEAMKLQNPDDPAEVFFTLLDDDDFMLRLEDGRVITGSQDQRAEWRSMRGELHALLDRVVFWRWGLRPADFDPLTTITHMFLHGGADHLLGNMIFLVLVGFLVEMTIGAPLFLSTYLVGGAMAGAADLLMAGTRFVPGVGASGAIAAMMGLYSVLFGLKRVRFFYSVGIWFDYARAPAIILLPLWLGWELFQWAMFTGSNINYAAHASGLTVGALSGLAILYFLPQRVDREFLNAPEQEAAEDNDRENADRLLRELDFDAARPLLDRLLKIQPRDPELLRRLHQCARIYPESRDYHQTVARILGQPQGREPMDSLVLDVYRDYRTRAKPRPQLTGRQIQNLAMRFCRQGHLREAEQLAAIILSRHQRFPAAPGLLVALAEGHTRAGHPERAQPHLDQVVALYPASSEAELARDLMRRLHG